jgi:hypothetical protein
MCRERARAHTHSDEPVGSLELVCVLKEWEREDCPPHRPTQAQYTRTTHTHNPDHTHTHTHTHIHTHTHTHTTHTHTHTHTHT